MNRGFVDDILDVLPKLCVLLKRTKKVILHPFEHGAPLRLRCETQLGYKMVKYLRFIEFVEDCKHTGKGEGGYREDFQYYGGGAEI